MSRRRSTWTYSRLFDHLVRIPLSASDSAITRSLGMRGPIFRWPSSWEFLLDFPSGASIQFTNQRTKRSAESAIEDSGIAAGYLPRSLLNALG